VELLNEVGYREMKVADVCARAGITPPVLYLYFDTKTALTTDVLEEFLDRFIATAGTGSGQSAYQAIYQANLRWITLARANAGLMRCLLELSAEEPAFAKLFAKASDAWYRRIADSVIRRFPGAAADRPAITLAVHALGGMIDEVTRKLFSGRPTELTRLVGTVAPGNDALAHFLSVLWYRALYAAEPPRGEALGPTPGLAGATGGMRTGRRGRTPS
jgi:AcrR family transcriptional regulator